MASKQNGCSREFCRPMFVAPKEVQAVREQRQYSLNSQNLSFSELQHSLFCDSPVPWCSVRAIPTRFDVPFRDSLKEEQVPSIPCHAAHVFDHSSVFHLKQARFSVKDAEVLSQKMSHLPDCLPDFLETADHKYKWRVDFHQLECVLVHGYDSRLVTLAEDMDLGSSVRLFTIPSQPAFSVRAKRKIQAGWITHSVATDCTRIPRWPFVVSLLMLLDICWLLCAVPWSGGP
jgi:hypothetical protein